MLRHATSSARLVYKKSFFPNRHMKKTYKYRLYPSKEQIEILNKTLNSCKNLYNTQLEYERYIYEKEIRFANKIELNNILPDLKIIDQSLKQIHSQILQNVNDRVIKSFNSFFNRIKRKQTPGYPRFKSISRYNSFTYPQSGFKLEKKLKLSKLGDIPIKLHRNIKGKIKTLTITKTPTNKWFACFSVKQDISPKKHSSNKIIGIDLGLENFATLSDNNTIENPRHLKKSLELLRRKSRQLSNKKKGSLNRKKSRLRLAKLHERVYNQRLDFLHKTTSKLVNQYDCIALEDLKVSSMNNKYLQFSINDVSWDKFRQLLVYKAEEAGCKLDFINPRNTSKRCSKCRELQDMPLSKRTYSCSCGNKISRDLNAALNILQKSYFYNKTIQEANASCKKQTSNVCSTEGHSGINACEDVSLETSVKQEPSSLLTNLAGSSTL